MKKLIFISVTLFGVALMFNGCYTYLTLANSKLAEEQYEPYFPPTPPPNPCLDCYPGPSPRPIIIIYDPAPQPDPYQRPREITDIRNSGAGRYSDNNGRR